MAEALIDSPIGPLYLQTTERGLRRLEFAGHDTRATETGMPSDPMLLSVAQQLREYFEGERRSFDVPLDLEGSPFRRRVWHAIASIPYGETLSYAEVAAAAGSPGAYRAAGAACGANPAVIIVPCHRVVGSDRSLHGFGGGLDTKARLLNMEGSLTGLRAGSALQAVLAAV